MIKLALNKKELSLFVSSILIIILASAVFVNSLNVLPAKAKFSENMLKVCLDIDVYDQNDVLKGSRTKPDDLVTWQFGSWLSCLLQDIDDVSLDAHVKLVDTTETEILKIRHDEVFGVMEGQAGTNGGDGAYINVGSGNTAPTINDYGLQTVKETYASCSGSYSGGNVTVVGTVAITSSYQLVEVGLFWNWYTSLERYCLLFRDVVDGISVVNGDTVQVTYTIILGENYTDNFGRMLASILQTILDNGATVEEWFIDDQNNNVTCVMQSGQVTEPVDWFFDYSLDDPVCGVKVGTGTTAAAKDDYNLESAVGDYVGVLSSSYVGGNVTVISLHEFSDSYSITEAGIFLEVRDNGGYSRTLMLVRDVFSAETVSNGDVFNMIFNLSS